MNVKSEEEGRDLEGKKKAKTTQRQKKTGERRGKTQDSELGISQKGHDSKPARDPLQVSNLDISRQCQMFINDVVTKIMLTDTWFLKEIE